jgi:hypothetical protein
MPARSEWGRHVLLVNPRLDGFAYGMQRDLETEVARLTGGELVTVPPRRLPWLIRRFTEPGTRYAPLGTLVSRSEFPVQADVLWVILMGPEDFPLWFHKGWDQQVGAKILYLYDSFESQLPTIRRLLARTRWDLTITSFPAAVPMLEQGTQRKWHAILQGVLPGRFYPLPDGDEPVIAFSSYGRRIPAVHAAVRAFAERAGLHYDYTVAAGLQPGTDARENYGIYAWHLRQSWFTFGWPVERTNPGRAKTFSPITCRWFEAAASGAVIVGDSPKDPAFASAFGPDFVVPFDPDAYPDAMADRLSELWANRSVLRARALAAARDRSAEWTWEARIREILALLGDCGLRSNK